MIRLIEYRDIDFAKYENCLKSSIQRKYSAEKDFLDTVTDNSWSVLVLNDYEAVMPLFYNHKFGVKLVQRPRLCQQLGIFSKEDNSKVNELFLNFLQQNFVVSFYAYNDHNKFETQLLTKKNYIIFRNFYEDIFKNYSENRRRELRKTAKLSFTLKKISFSEAETFIFENFAGNFRDKEKAKFLAFYQNFYETGKLEIFCVMSENRIINLAGIYKAEGTAVLLLFVNEKKSTNKSGATLLIDNALKIFSAKLDFDFEGSNIPAIEEFYRRFGAKVCPYPYIQNTRKDLFFNVLKHLSGLKFLLRSQK